MCTPSRSSASSCANYGYLSGTSTFTLENLSAVFASGRHCTCGLPNSAAGNALARRPLQSTQSPQRGVLARREKLGGLGLVLLANRDGEDLAHVGHLLQVHLAVDRPDLAPGTHRSGPCLQLPNFNFNANCSHALAISPSAFVVPIKP